VAVDQRPPPRRDRRLRVRLFGAAAVLMVALVALAVWSTRPGEPPLEPPPPPTGDTFFVRPDGSDAADGQTVETAWRSLEAALERIEAGHVVYVMDGVYHQPRCEGCGSHFRLDTSGTPEAWVRVLNFPGHRPEIRADTGTAIEVVGSYIEFSGFQLTGDGFSASNNWGFGIMVEDGHDLRVTDNIIYGFPLSGIGAFHTSRLSIEDNVVSDNAWWSPDAGSGISILWPRDYGLPPDPEGYHDRVVGNVVFGNENRVPTPDYAPDGLVSDGNGIIIDQTLTSEYPGRILVMNNVAVNNGGKGINVFRSAHVDVVHNTLYRNGFSQAMYGENGDLAVSRSVDVRVLNNLIEPSDDRRAVVTHDSEGVEMVGNVIAGGLAPGDSLDRTTNVVTAGPAGFVNPDLDAAEADFSLTAGSPAIERAAELDLPVSVDHAAGLRPAGSAPDAGAYQRQSTG
jgi:hypothetical protein